MPSQPMVETILFSDFPSIISNSKSKRELNLK